MLHTKFSFPEVSIGINGNWYYLFSFPFKVFIINRKIKNMLTSFLFNLADHSPAPLGKWWPQEKKVIL